MLIIIDNAALFANLIARTAQDIDTLIDSLPSKELTPEKQVDTLRKLEHENQQSAERLSRAVKEGGEGGIEREGGGERERGGGGKEGEKRREVHVHMCCMKVWCVRTIMLPYIVHVDGKKGIIYGNQQHSDCQSQLVQENNITILKKPNFSFMLKQ